MNYKIAFPKSAFSFADIKQPEMTLKEYAAIHLKVPNSGNKELDDMIRQSLFTESLVTYFANRSGHVDIDYATDLVKRLITRDINAR